jgi:hypothetical protein
MRFTTIGLLVSLILCGCDRAMDDEFSGPADQCSLAGASDYFDLGGDFWVCDLPDPRDGEVDMEGYEGQTSLVNGAVASFDLFWSGPALDGKTLIVGVPGDGFYRVPLSGSPDPLPLDLAIHQEVSGSFDVWVGVADGFDEDDHPITGEYIVIPIHITQVLTGDVQVNVHWDTDNDVDLHVVAPNGEEIYWGQPNGASGGQLDLDSNAACDIDGVNNENIYWPTGGAPEGEYIVRVDLWASCNNQDVDYRVTVVLGGADISVFDGSFVPADADNGGPGAGVELTRFDWNGS